MLLLDVPAVVRPRPDGTVEVVDFATGALLDARGVFADAVSALVTGATLPSAARALVESHPLLLRLQQAQERWPLTAASVVQMGGFDTLFLEVVGACNERCVHCYADSSPQVRAVLSRRTCLGVIDDAATLGFRRVQLTGGDPLLCRFLPDLAARIGAWGMTCEIYTNGLLLKDEVVRSLVPHGVRFAFSFYSADAVVHERITRTPGSHALTLRAIERALAAGVPTRVSVIAMAENAPQLPATVELLRQVGVEEVGVAASYAVGRGDRFSGELSMSLHGSHRGKAPGVQKQPRRRGSLCVTYRGEVTPCIFNRTDVLGHVPARRLVDIATAPELPVSTGEAREVLASCRNSLQCRSCQTTAFALRTGACR